MRINNNQSFSFDEKVRCCCYAELSISLLFLIATVEAFKPKFSILDKRVLCEDVIWTKPCLSMTTSSVKSVAPLCRSQQAWIRYSPIRSHLFLRSEEDAIEAVSSEAAVT